MKPIILNKEKDKKRNIHILSITQNYPPEVAAGGIRFYNLNNQWKDKVDKLSIITAFPNHPYGILFPGFSLKWYKKKQIDNIDIINSWIYLAPNKGKLRRIINYISFMISSIINSRHCKNPDVVIATSPQFLVALSGYVISKIKRKPFVLDIRDLWPDSIIAVEALKNNFMLKIMFKLEQFLYKKANAIIAVSPAFKELIVKKSNINPEKIHIITNGIDESFKNYQKNTGKSILPANIKNKFIVSYIGTIGMAHKLENLVDTAKILSKRSNDIHFLIVGDGANKDNLENYINKLELKNVTLMSSVERNKVKDILDSVDVAVVHLKKNSVFRTVIPSKLFEYMLMEKPILHVADGYSCKLIEESKAGLVVQQENPEDLADKILYLKDNKDIRDKMGKNGYNYVINNYQIKNLAKKYLDVLSNLI